MTVWSSWRRPFALALTCTMPALAAAQQPAPTFVENPGKDLLAAERIAALPAETRKAWSAYIDRSRQLHALDTAAMNTELRAASRSQMEKAPYKAAGFDLFDRPDAWFQTDSVAIVGNPLPSFQTPSGGWSKRTDMSHPRSAGMSYYAETADWHYTPTLDNGATTGQVRFLGRVMRYNSDPRFADAFHRGLEYLLAAQMPNGCWPQSFPLEGGYHDAITMNDDAMVLVLTTLDEVASGLLNVASVSERQRATASAKRGVQCLVETQVTVDGTRTVWGQQHDPISLEVVPARSYELAGLAGRESAGVMMYLISLPNPSDGVVNAVHAAAAWFRSHAITGYRYDAAHGLRADATGEPIWARLTEIATNKPVFANRDGIKLYDWDKLTDRRTGYAWFSTEPAVALKKYEIWKQSHPAMKTRGTNE